MRREIPVLLVAASIFWGFPGVVAEANDLVVAHSREGGTRAVLSVGPRAGISSHSRATLTPSVPPPPSITSVAANPGRTTVVVTWTTDTQTDSQVEYGLTTSYTSISQLDSSTVVFHAATLFLLQPSTTYHYRVRSRDAAGNLAVSADGSFTTLASTAPTGVKVAFIGDQGLGPDSVAVLQLIKSEGAQVVFHQGDFDYSDNPAAWDQQITSVLGAGFPYFASLGNHDASAMSGYQQVLQARLNLVPDASCSGALAVLATCIYKGLLVTFTAPGLVGSGQDLYIRDQLAQSNFAWRISSWHELQKLMQVGGKGDQVGWGVYEQSRLAGAIVATGHEHSYERTYLMSSFQNQTVASTANPLQLSPGQSFAFVSGLGGESIRVQQLSGAWWAAIYTSTQGANFGALFCTFGVNDQPNRASCYFKDISGRVPDQFDLVSAVTGTGAAPEVTFSPSSLSFAGQNVGTTSAAQTVTLTNTSSGNAALNITGIAVTGANTADFAVSPTGPTPCSFGPSILPAGSSCAFNVTFTPGAAGARAANVAVTSNATPSSSSLPLSGAGTTPVAGFSPSPVTFGNQIVGLPSAPQMVTLSNAGDGTMNLTSIATTGANAADFALTPAGATPCSFGSGSLAPGTSCTLNVTFTPGAVGARSASLTVASNALTSPDSDALTGTGTLQGVGFSPLAVAFGNQLVGAASAPRLVTVTNTGSATLSVTSIATTGINAADFPLSPAGAAPCSFGASSLASGSSCTVNVTFIPGATGARLASVTVTSSSATSPDTLPVSGAGVAPAVGMSPSSVVFGNQLVGSASNPSTVTLINTGTGPLSITSVATTGANAADFALSPTGTTPCASGASDLTPGNSCTFNVTFTPGATGSRVAGVTFISNAPTSPDNVPLSGTGVVPVVQLSATGLAFGNQRVTTSSAAQSVTLTNTGSAPLAISSLSITGANPGEFSKTDNCGAGMNPSLSCAISVTFTPATTGAKNAEIAITDNAAGSPHTAGLSGAGVAPAVSLTTANVAFGNQRVGTTSAAQTVTLINSGTDTLHISSVMLGGANANEFALAAGTSCTSGAAVAAGTNCQLSLTFAPTATGARAAAVTLTDDATGSPRSVTVSGTGTVPTASLFPASLAFGSQLESTTSGISNVTLTNSGTATLNISGITLTGANAVDFTLGAPTSGVPCPLGASNLGAGVSCTVGVVFRPTGLGARGASFTVADDAAGSPHSVPLSGTGVAPTVVLAPTSVGFADQRVGTSGSTTTVTLTNGGTAILNITSISVTGGSAGDFALVVPASGTPCPTGASSLGVGVSCTLGVAFRPSGLGVRGASLTVVDDAVGSPQSVPLSGNGIAPVVALNPTGVSFGNQRVGITSAMQSVVLANTGTDLLHLSSVVMSGADAGEFALAAGTTCTSGATLAAGANCQFNLSFTPAAAGARAAAVVLTDDASGSPHSVALSGAGVAPAVSLTTANVAFGNQRVGTTSAAQTVTLINSGTDTLHISSVMLGGANANEFALAAGTSCTSGATVAAGTNCQLSLTFMPATTGQRVASVSIADDAAGSPHTMAISGTGTAPALTLSRTSVSFANVNIGAASAGSPITLTNSGTDPLSITSISISGAASGDFSQTNTCPLSPATVTMGGTCTVNPMFRPTVTGIRSASLTIVDDAAGSPRVIALDGDGVDFALSAPTGPTTVKAGQPANYTINLTTQGGALASAVTFGCTNLPTSASCLFNPFSIPAGSTTGSAALTITTMARTATAPSASLPPFVNAGRLQVAYSLLLGLLALCLALARRVPQRKWVGVYLFFMVVLALATYEVGCGGGGGASAPPPPPGTPAGSYTIGVTALSGSVSRTTSVTLNVQ